MEFPSKYASFGGLKWRLRVLPLEGDDGDLDYLEVNLDHILPTTNRQRYTLHARVNIFNQVTNVPAWEGQKRNKTTMRDNEVNPPENPITFNPWRVPAEYLYKDGVIKDDLIKFHIYVNKD